MRRLSFKTQFKIEFLGPFYGRKKSLLQEIIFVSKGQVRCIQTLTVQVEVPSLETSKFSLYFSGTVYLYPHQSEAFVHISTRISSKKKNRMQAGFLAVESAKRKKIDRNRRDLFVTGLICTDMFVQVLSYRKFELL
jgi:hypothetical protein